MNKLKKYLLKRKEKKEDQKELESFEDVIEKRTSKIEIKMRELENDWEEAKNKSYDNFKVYTKYIRILGIDVLVFRNDYLYTRSTSFDIFKFQITILKIKKYTDIYITKKHY